MSSNSNAPRDANAVPTALFAQQGATSFVAPGQINEITGRVLVDLGSTPVGSVIQTDVFVATANQTVFTATMNVAGVFYVSVNGAIQTPSNVDPAGYYTQSGQTFTFSSGQVVGSIIILCYATS